MPGMRTRKYLRFIGRTSALANAQAATRSNFTGYATLPANLCPFSWRL